MSGLDIPRIAELLGVSRPRVWQLRKQPGFPTPDGQDKAGRDYWYEHTILRWAAGNGRLADRAPLLFRPVPPGPAAEYFGTRVVLGGTVLTWDTRLGRVCMHFPGPNHANAKRPAPQELSADAVVTVLWTEDLYGPELEARDAAHPDRTYEPDWTDLANLLGTPAPWWPVRLRRPADMALWKPGARPTVINPVPDVDPTPLLQLAAGESDGSSAHATLTHLARTILARADEGARRDLNHADKWRQRDAIAIAGTPTPATEPGEEPDEAVRRDGWLRVLSRADSLAAACVNVALVNDGGRDFPFSSFAEIDPHDGELAAEFAARIEPCERTAAFALFSEHTVAETWIDPQTGLPVAKDHSGKLRAAVPHRLPATAPLAEVTLDHDTYVWIRTTDGSLWLAPEQSGAGLSWGYGGGGPHTLAVLLDLLLDDINAPAPDIGDYVDRPLPPGLLAGATGKWRTGTTLTRADLEAARAS